MDSFKTTLVDLNQSLLDFEDSISKRSKEIEDILNNASKQLEKFESAWSGSWLKAYADFYFERLEKPPINKLLNPQDIRLFGVIPPGWVKVSLHEIAQLIEENGQFSIAQVQEEVHHQAEQAMKIRDHLCVELSLIKGQKIFEVETKELEEIETLEWGMSIHEYISRRQPRTLFANPTDIQMGLEAPPHIRLQAQIVHLLTNNSSVLEFLRKSRKLIRKIQIKGNLAQEHPSIINYIENVIKICNSFHAVARQLRQRHQGKDTLVIEDEYDVQDLFHALLKVFFEDVRPEEYTPSYAGGSSRVDFLLPQEKIVIEIKKTRKGLADKEVGTQLLIDIARYQSHPNCKNLICFVYDPESRIGNPKGLENDLNNYSSEKINIITIIRPT